MTNPKTMSILLLSLLFLGIASAFSSDEEPIPDFGPEGPAGIRTSDHVPDFRLMSNESNSRAKRVSQSQLLQAVLKRLDLSDVQKEEIMRLMADFRVQGEELRANIRRMQDTVKTARLSEGDASTVQAVRGEIAGMVEQSKSLAGEVQDSILNILSNDQQEKFNQIRGKLAKRASGKSPK